MSAQNEQPENENQPAEAKPIEFVTENGFAVLRLWEVARLPHPTTKVFHFIVRGSDGKSREITVEIADDAFRELSLHVQQRILPRISFWICCAERHLATYLWENDSYPAGNKLIVQQLDPEETILAARWETTDQLTDSEQAQTTFDLGGFARWLTR